MEGRKVRTPWGEAGRVTKWEPLSAGMTDALVRYDDGREVWHASHTLKPTDGRGPLPSREGARRKARAEALKSLRAVREQMVREWRNPWPGAEHGKAIVGKAVAQAIEDLEAEDRSLSGLGNASRWMRSPKALGGAGYEQPDTE